MKIQQLFLRNVRSIKSLDLDFRDPVTGKPMSRIVLAGANGGGKTTILECTFGMLSDAERDKHTLEDVPFVLAFDAQIQLLLEVGYPSTRPTMFSLSYRDPIVKETPVSELRTFFKVLPATIKGMRAQEEEVIGSVLYFPHNRYLPSFQQGELGLEPKVYQWAYRYQANDQWKGSTESYLFSLNYLDLEDRDRKTPANRFGQTVEIVNSILDGKRIDRVERGRVVIETTNGQTHGLDELSSGEKQIVLLLIEITRRIVPGSVILIDEPEVSLHPAWQRGLVAALDKIVEQYDAQVIMATHSLEIVKMMYPEEVFILTDRDLPMGEWKPEVETLA